MHVLGIDWHYRYLSLAKEVSTWSKDPSSQIGAVAVGAKGQVLAQGYNGFPRGIQHSAERLNTRELKYKFVVHAEMNLIYNATYNGVSLDGSTVYVHGLPCCSECAKGLIQVGVDQVIMPKMPEDTPQIWQDSFELTAELFKEAKVAWQFI
jgi:dCMP deaminase|tara:strand:+ start:167 stop:619 length:453 start_codon:yes stop_codon:yes gene_type:complete